MSTTSARSWRACRIPTQATEPTSFSVITREVHPFPAMISGSTSAASIRLRAPAMKPGFHLASLQHAHLLEHIPGATGYASHSDARMASCARHCGRRRQSRARHSSRFSSIRKCLALYDSAFAPVISLRQALTRISSNDPTHNGKIDAEIIVQIKQSRFVVADSTCANPNVYFEAGYALASACQSFGRAITQLAIKIVKFDTRQYNHILWDDGPHLMKQLTARIGATIT